MNMATQCLSVSNEIGVSVCQMRIFKAYQQTLYHRVYGISSRADCALTMLSPLHSTCRKRSAHWITMDKIPPRFSMPLCYQLRLTACSHAKLNKPVLFNSSSHVLCAHWLTASFYATLNLPVTCRLTACSHAKLNLPCIFLHRLTARHTTGNAKPASLCSIGQQHVTLPLVAKLNRSHCPLFYRPTVRHTPSGGKAKPVSLSSVL